MIDKRYEFYIFSFLVTMFMSFIISAILIIINLGFTNEFLLLLLNAWWKAWIVAFFFLLFL